MWCYVWIYLSLLAVVGLLRWDKLPLFVSKKQVVKSVMIIGLTNSLAFGMTLVQCVSEQSGQTEKIERDDYGGTVKTEAYVVEIDGKEREEVAVEISPRVYNSEETQELFQAGKEELDTLILGENRTLECVDHDLNLPSEIEGYPFRISWELSRYDVMDMSGSLVQEEILEKDPDGNGIELTLTGTMTYEGETDQYLAQLTVFAKTEEESTAKSLRKLVEEANEADREEAFLRLPTQWNGQTLKWTKKEQQSNYYVVLLGVVISGLLLFDEKEKQVKKKKERREEMLLDYPEIVSQFTMLMGAGMTAKNVWQKIVEDYNVQKERTGRSREAYEEMVCTWQEMQSGISEVECYERFGRRCEVMPYMKMGALLSQNLRKGAKGLAEMLTLEAVEAMEEKKNKAKRLGEEAGTKLLGPMLLMLIIVLAIVVVPAFWSANL